ncbi:hypothetical protein IT882_04330 [Microbacterium schleiferi]|uniref:Uncharacterized protein n=1 Tax=Microbacterium schleiferi TaxID=69362 RepID=A0A7S8RIE3_9MICO|nr:hypothetical protein [Microbacterium schleiferi]QPE05301.1 hypothetical protein IT882_04330 [Microbacterium schleiferi]
MPVIAPLKFELRYRREAYKVVGSKLVRDAERDATLPERPPQFTPLVGDFSTVHDRASELNDAQVRSGFRHYFFFPEIHGDRFDTNHCDMCRRLAAKMSDG